MNFSTSSAVATYILSTIYEENPSIMLPSTYENTIASKVEAIEIGNDYDFMNVLFFHKNQDSTYTLVEKKKVNQIVEKVKANSRTLYGIGTPTNIKMIELKKLKNSYLSNAITNEVAGFATQAGYDPKLVTSCIINAIALSEGTKAYRTQKDKLIINYQDDLYLTERTATFFIFKDAESENIILNNPDILALILGQDSNIELMDLNNIPEEWLEDSSDLII